MYLTENYKLPQLQVDTDTYVLAKPKDAIKLNVSTIKKQLTQIQKFTNLPTVLVLEKMESNKTPTWETLRPASRHLIY